MRLARRSIIRTGAATVTAAVVCALPVAWGVSESAGTSTCEEPATKTKPASAPPDADFDKDGHADLVANSPDSEVDGEDNAGYVSVTYGSEHGTDARHHQVLRQGHAGVPGKAASGAYFGSRSTARDFDGDGFTDLAVGARKKSQEGNYSAGIILMFGSQKGLTEGTWLKTPGELDEKRDEFDFAGGDFTGGGAADLVLAAGEEHGLLKGPFTRQGTAAETDEVPSGTHPDNWVEDTAAGDITGDGIDDLALTQKRAGGRSEPALIIKGGRDGLTALESGRLPKGMTATIGDIDKDGHGDLVVARAPGEGSEKFSNRIEVVYGAKSGLSNRYSVLDQDTEGVPGDKTRKDNAFGKELDAGDVDGDGYADVAVGNPGQRVKDQYHAGAATLLKGSACGLTGEGAQRFTTATRHIPGKPAYMEELGSAVQLLDTDDDGHADLAAGSVGQSSSGHAWVLPGSAEGANAKGSLSIGPEDLEEADDLRTIGFAEAFTH